MIRYLSIARAKPLSNARLGLSSSSKEKSREQHQFISILMQRTMAKRKEIDDKRSEEPESEESSSEESSSDDVRK